MMLHEAPSRRLPLPKEPTRLLHHRHPPTTMRAERGGRVVAACLLVLILLSATPNAAALRIDGLNDGERLEVKAKTTVLVEEMTATWCATCADIDPYLAEVADRHGSRLALVALHPLDGQDGVATNASEARLDRWRSVHGNLTQTPAFLVEGEAPLVGPEVWPDVTRRMLELESGRNARPNLGINATREAGDVLFELHAEQPEHGRQLTLMVLEHARTPAAFGVEVVQGSTYDRALVELHTLDADGAWSSVCTGPCDLTMNGTMNGTLAWADDAPFSLILIDETADGNLSLETTHSEGAVELAVRPSTVEAGADHRWALAATLLAGGVAVAVWPTKTTESGRKISEEE
ncbi:MAG TPA: thioredoxin family protein [Candidatus Poseidoniales archaeon]|nr:MAG TPA: thioredoxin family protein [Candidatus Poseidoniales archaeon]DAC16932.1 MAG TPA: thioredoxin family protein [Candidatus Poseidoniales archaeon]